MPSPPPVPSGSAQNGTIPQPAVSNGISNSGEQDAPGRDVPVSNGALKQASESNKSPESIIEEGKLKAKAIMAASGIVPQSPRRDEVVANNDIATTMPNMQVNGAGESRKRSRSGTRRPESHRPHLQSIPSRREEDIKRGDAVKLETYLHRDLVHEAGVEMKWRAQQKFCDDLTDELKEYTRPAVQRERKNNPGAFFGHGYAGYGNGNTDLGPRPSRIVYPSQRKRPGGRKTKELHVPRRDLTTQAEQIDELVPIRLDIEWDKIRLRDTFTWNIHDRVVPIELFAERLVEDFKLPLEQCGPLIQQVCASVQEQIQDFHPHVFIDEEALDPHLPYHAYKNDEMRIMIKLNITIGQHTLVDQFEWEINNPMNSPEDFARQMTHDLSLSGEFTTAIAHSIREQSQLFTRSLYVTAHPFDGRPIDDPELKASFLQSPLPSPFRPYQAAKEFSPYLYELNEIELEKTELSLSREERRQKRSVNRRGGPALPDLKDRRRTIRTLVVSSVLPGAAESIEDSRIFKRTAASSGKARRPGLGQRDGGDDSDESESEDSSPDSPAIQSHLLTGTARTRGLRGAASVAQLAMRATIGRSATPESSILHHHETRTSGRRVAGREYREDSSVDPPNTLIVKLRISKEKFQRFLRDQRARSKEESLQPPASNPRSASHRSPSVNSIVGAPVAGSMGPPSTTPRIQQQNLPVNPAEVGNHPETTSGGQAALKQPDASKLGRIETTGPPGPDNPMVCCIFPYCLPASVLCTTPTDSVLVNQSAML